MRLYVPAPDFSPSLCRALPHFAVSHLVIYCPLLFLADAVLSGTTETLGFSRGKRTVSLPEALSFYFRRHAIKSWVVTPRVIPPPDDSALSPERLTAPKRRQPVTNQLDRYMFYRLLRTL
jgi:hypothetical protein